MVNPKKKKKNEKNTPYSVISAIKKKKNSIKNYWNKSGSFMVLYNHINRNFKGLKENIGLLMNNRKNDIKINISLYRNDMGDFKTKDEILTHLVHLGYLRYNCEKKTVYIPNNEVNVNFKNCADMNADWKIFLKKKKKKKK